MSVVALRCGVVFWYADAPPPRDRFEHPWVALYDDAPARFAAYLDVDDVTAVHDSAGTVWQQIFPDGPRTLPAEPESSALMVVHTRPRSGLSDDEFNAWYDTDHLPPLAASDSVVRVRRFHRAGEEFPYLALYDITDWEAWTQNPARPLVRSTPWAKRVVKLFDRTEGYYRPLTATEFPS
ncbi:MAG TPA: hypothetical protein VG266_06075 [Candidatus Dormibacteraeota bacterium]|jgi:hypothetical protein|nr:hypothetical protein [Candidatus Dormibacteraeota bacterium]